MFYGVCSVVVVFSISILSSVFMVRKSFVDSDSFYGLEMVVFGTMIDEVSTIIKSKIMEVSTLDGLQ